MTDSILSHLEHGVMTITLNRPEVFNSFNQNMGQAFQQWTPRRMMTTSGAWSCRFGSRLLRWTRFEGTSDTSPGLIIVEETYNRSIRLICNMEKPVIAAVNWLPAIAAATSWQNIGSSPTSDLCPTAVARFGRGDAQPKP